MESAKRISVIMCTYNGEKFLREQIDSILSQTYPIYELIIQDDCSTDHTADIVRAYQEQDSRIKWHLNNRKLGFNYNFSNAFAKATGEYIASSDQDDIWRADKIEILVENMSDNCLVFHNSLLFSQDPAHVIGRKNAAHVLYNELYLLLKPYVPGHECFFKRELLISYQQIVAKEQDISYDSLLLLIGRTSGHIAFINEGLVYWRRHQQATSYSSKKKNGTLLSGLLSAFKALTNKSKRNITQRYFTALTSLPFEEESTTKIVRLMASGKTTRILMACRLCYTKRKQLYPHINPAQARIKSFFTPLYFIRDCSKFAIANPLLRLNEA